MKLSKFRMFMVLNGLIALFLVVYFGIWIMGEKTTARVIPPYAASKITAVYQVGSKTYTRSYLRNDVSFSEQYITISYLNNRPSSSRVYSYMGIAAEPLAWWFVFLIASSMLLLTDNLVFSKSTVFKLQKRFPWISMEEYFRLPWYYKEPTSKSTFGPRSKNTGKRLKDH